MGKGIGYKEIIRKIIFLVSLVVFSVCAFKLYDIWSEYNNNSKSYEKLQDYSPSIVEDNGENTFKFSPEDYYKLLSLNNDFKAWIRIEGTNISYPVVQTKDNDFYLSHNFDKESNSGGAIFISSNITSPFQDKNTVIHGHNMKDGSMFADLSKYKDSYFAKNTPIYINTRDKEYKYEIISVITEKASNDTYQVSFNTYEEYENYLKNIKSKSFYDFGMDVAKEDEIIILSTCDYDIKDGRLVVVGKLVSVK